MVLLIRLYVEVNGALATLIAFSNFPNVGLHTEHACLYRRNGLKRKLQKSFSRSKTECHKSKKRLEKDGRSSVIGLVGGKNGV